MKIDIIIPNYNGSELIQKNLPSVIEATKGHPGTKFIIVDDGSEKKDKELLYVFLAKEKNENIVLLENEHNIGFAGTVNKGVKYSAAEFVVLLNSDVVPDKDFLNSPLKSLTTDPNLFGVGCMDKSIEHGEAILRGRGEASWKKGFLQHKRGEVDKSNTFWISGGSSIIRREIFQKLKGFDEIYNPFYWEDIDLSYRAQKSGYKIIFDSESKVTHKHEEGAIKRNFSKNTVKRIAFRNELIFVWKNITSTQMIISHICHLLILMTKSLLKLDKTLLRGFFEAIKKLPDIMTKRQLQKKLYVRSDKEILAEFK